MKKPEKLQKVTKSHKKLRSFHGKLRTLQKSLIISSFHDCQSFDSDFPLLGDFLPVGNMFSVDWMQIFCHLIVIFCGFNAYLLTINSNFLWIWCWFFAHLVIFVSIDADFYPLIVILCLFDVGTETTQRTQTSRAKQLDFLPLTNTLDFIWL